MWVVLSYFGLIICPSLFVAVWISSFKIVLCRSWARRYSDPHHSYPLTGHLTGNRCRRFRSRTTTLAAEARCQTPFLTTTTEVVAITGVTGDTTDPRGRWWTMDLTRQQCRPRGTRTTLLPSLATTNKRLFTDSKIVELTKVICLPSVFFFSFMSWKFMTSFGP
jgi:hypothetical protein